MGSHPLGNINQFHGYTSTPKVSGLPWREHAVARPLVFCQAQFSFLDVFHYP
jgi:hypothetical protein